MTEPERSGPEGAGGLLRAAREKQGLHIAALAAAIKVAPRKLDALENNRWSELPDATFTRALAQTVCRTLKIDAKPVLDLLPAVEAGKLENVAGTLNTPFRERGSPADHGGLGAAVRPMIWAGGLLLLAALAVLLMPEGGWSFLRPGGAAVTAEAPPAPVSMALPAEPAAPQASGAGPADPAPAVEAASAAAAAASEASAPPSAVALATTAPAAAPASVPSATLPAASGDVIQIVTVQPSWVEARDAQGRVLLSRLVAAGEDLALDGEKPIRLVIGNAAGVTLNFRQQRVDLQALTRDNVARLQLP